jgi:hypothetical protein
MRMPSDERQDEMAVITEKLGYDFHRVLDHETVSAYGTDLRTRQMEQVFLRIVEDRVYVYTYSQELKV